MSQNPLFNFDSGSPSCARVIYGGLVALNDQFSRFADLVQAADEIDSANYTSAEEALFSVGPGQLINCGLPFPGDEKHMRSLITALARNPLEEVAASRDVRLRAEIYEKNRDQFLTDLPQNISFAYDGKIGIQFSSGDNNQYTRYGAFHRYPNLIYLVQINRGLIRISVNPWYQGPHVNLADFVNRIDARAGGHAKVGVVRKSFGGLAQLQLKKTHFSLIPELWSSHRKALENSSVG